MIIPDLVELGHLNKERFHRIAGIYRSEGMADKDSQLTNIDYLKNEKDFHVWTLWVLGFFIFTIVVIIIIIITTSAVFKRPEVHKKGSEDKLFTEP